MTEQPLPPTDNAAAATGERQDPGATRHGSQRRSTKSRKQDEIRSISEFLTYVYSSASRSFSITPAVRKALASDETDLTVLAEQVTQLAASDLLLAVPPKVLTTMERSRVGGRLRRTLLTLMALPLLHHPGLASVDLAAALSDEPTPDHDALLCSVREAPNRLEPGQLGKASLRSADLRTLQDNAVLSVALLVAIKDDWPTTVFADCLDRYLWQEDLTAAEIPSERALLIDGASSAALIARVWHGRLAEAKAEAHDALQRSQEAIRHADAMAEAMEQMEKVITQREETIATLRTELATEREHRRIEKSHAVDDYESLRSQLVRGLVQQTSLLEDGLHALRNRRVGVTEEYLERVIESLREDLQRLRGGVKMDRGE